MARSVRASPSRSDDSAQNERISGSSEANSERACPISPNTTAGPTRRSPLTSGRRPSSASISVVLPLPFGPAIESRSPHWTPKSTRPEPERAALDDRILQRNDEVARAPGRSEVEPQLPRLPRLLDAVALEPLDAPRRRAGLRHQRMRAAPARLLARHAGLLAPLAVQVAEAGALLAPLRVGALVLGARPLAGRLVLAPAAGVVMHALRARLELDDLIHGPVEERAVVRDDHEASVEPEQEALEQLEAVEVEVVRRLVEQVDVEAREQDRGQSGSAALAAGKVGDAPFELDVEPDPPERRSRARFELHRRLLAGPPLQVRKQALARENVALLREVADPQRRRIALHGTAVELLEAGERAQQRRLAAAVRADDADPAAGA